MRKALLLGLALPFAATAANAVTITPTINTTAGTTYNTAALTGFTTLSANMIGSIVTVTFLGGATNSGVWTATGASNTGWSLSVAGDTFSSPWTFTNTGVNTITGFSFNGVPGNTAFDIVNGGATEGSPGSAEGQPMSSVDGPFTGMTVTTTYTNRLTVAGTFYGDLYTQMNVVFGGTAYTRGDFTYVSDTDNALASAGGITPGIPEPATWAMMLLGFGGLGHAMRRRPRATARVRFV